MHNFFEIFGLEADNYLHVLLILMVVVWGAGRIFKSFSLPPMLGEILAGVIMGPAVLGILDSTEIILVLAELGVFFLMFHSGLDTDVREFFGRAKVSVLVAVGGIIPIFLISFFVLQTAFEFEMLTNVFVATVLCLNSIPVIISVLKTYGLKNSKVGHTVLGATVVNEVILFVVLSVIIAIAKTGEANLLMVAMIMLKVMGFFCVTLFLGRVLLPKISPYILNKSGSKGFTFALIIALFFAILAENIGLHMVLGAYLAGMFVREEITNDEIMRKIEDRFYALSHSFLGPIFFASVGMAISFTVLFENPTPVFVFLGIVVLGQLMGSGLVAFWNRFSKRDSLLTGALLSGRGSTEIVIAQVGFSTIVLATGQRLIPEDLFVILIALSFLSTFLMPFLVKFLLKYHRSF